MIIVTTLSEVLHSCRDWIDFCNDKKYNEWAVNEGGGDVEVRLTIEEAIKHGIIDSESREIIRNLQEEVREYALDAFHEIATLEKDGEHEGWYCTNARSSAVGLGDRLVELGVFKKSDKGFGRVQYFRSINEG